MKLLLYLYTTAYQKLNSNTNDKTKILDPLNTIIKLAMLSYKVPNTKLSIVNHNINLHEPSYFQGVFRIYNGDNKEDLHYLLNPIYIATKKYINKDNIILFELAKNGLKLLKDTYKNYQTIIHTLDLYIYIIDNFINEKVVDYSFVKITEEEEELYNKFIYKWQKEEINIIINLFNLINNSPLTSKIHYLTSIEKILIPIDETIKNISYIT